MSESTNSSEASKKKACGFCGQGPAGDEKLKLCSGCGLVAYCSKEHQREDWKNHKTTCQQKHKKANTSSSSGSSGSRPEEIEVLWEDQKRINAFGRLNHRLTELDDEIKEKQNEVDNLKDAATELEGVLDDNGIKMRVGEVFIDVEGDKAETNVRKKLKQSKKDLKELQLEREKIVTEMTDLKVRLYGKFGKSINLESN